MVRDEALEEGPQRRRVRARIRRHLVQEARELAADLREHLAVAARDSIARALEGVERRVQLRGHPPERCVRVQEPAPQQHAAQRCPTDAAEPERP